MRGSPSSEERIGLCASCRQVTVVRSDRGAVFYQCQRAAADPSFPRYPMLPMLRCPGYEASEPAPSKAHPEPS